MKPTHGLSGKALRLLLCLTLISSSLSWLPGIARADDRLLQHAAVTAVTEDLRLMGLELDTRNLSRHQNSESVIWYYALKESEYSRFDMRADLLPLALLVVEKDGVLDHVQTITLDRGAAGPRLVMEVTIAADPDHSVIFTVDRNVGGETSSGIFLAARDRNSGERFELGLLQADESGQPYLAETFDRGYYDCLKACVNDWLAELGFWTAIGVACCVIGGGIVGVVGGAATLGAAAAAAVPIIKLCLEALAFAATGTTVTGVVGCMVACIFD